MQPPASRNAPCPCGSGRRYKDCHGRLDVAPSAPADACRESMRRALALQQQGALADAERLYRQALALVPDEPDALHMLAVTRLAQGDARDARALLLRALDLVGWGVPAMRGNLGLVLAANVPEWHREDERSLRERSRAAEAARASRRRPVTPLVSVVIPSYNHVHFVERAIASVAAQTYRPIELVVIDDGSTDGSPAMIERSTRDASFPVRVACRGNLGAHATLNEGVDLARGEFVQFLNSDDALEPTRVARMVDEVAASGALWGFSSLSIVGADDGPPDGPLRERAQNLLASVARVARLPTVGLAFVAGNPAVSTGNLFVARDFARDLRFAGYRYNHDWEFCLRALEQGEPVFVDEALYRYRLHGANTIVESPSGARDEAHGVVAAFLARALSGARTANPFAPSATNCGAAFVDEVLRAGMAGLVDADRLRGLVLEWFPEAGSPSAAVHRASGG